MRIVIAVDKWLDETPLARVPRLLPVRGAEVLIVHVLDSGGRDEWGLGAERRLLRPHPRAPEVFGVRMQAADRAGGERVVAASAIEASAWAVARVETRLLEGSPRHEIRALLDAEGADVLAVFVRGREVGPKSIHKEARFLIDHAPCAVLVVKTGP